MHEKSLKEKNIQASIYDFVIISMDNSAYNFWMFFHTFTCLASSYFYAYVAAFDFNDPYMEHEAELRGEGESKIT